MKLITINLKDGWLFVAPLRFFVAPFGFFVVFLWFFVLLWYVVFGGVTSCMRVSGMCEDITCPG